MIANMAAFGNLVFRIGIMYVENSLQPPFEAPTRQQREACPNAG